MIQPLGNPGSPARPSLSETSIKTRKISGLPRHVRGKQTFEKGFAHGNNALVPNPFRSLVASPATPNTPTPAPMLGSGYNCESPHLRTVVRNIVLRYSYSLFVHSSTSLRKYYSRLEFFSVMLSLGNTDVDHQQNAPSRSSQPPVYPHVCNIPSVILPSNP